MGSLFVSPEIVWQLRLRLLRQRCRRASASWRPPPRFATRTGQWYLRFDGDVSGILPINDDKATAHKSSKLNALASGVKRKGDFRRTEAILTSSYLE